MYCYELKCSKHLEGVLKISSFVLRGSMIKISSCKRFLASMSKTGIFLYVFLTPLPSLETQCSVGCVPNLHFKLPYNEEGNRTKGHYT